MLQIYCKQLVTQHCFRHNKQLYHTCNTFVSVMGEKAILFSDEESRSYMDNTIRSDIVKDTFNVNLELRFLSNGAAKELDHSFGG